MPVLPAINPYTPKTRQDYRANMIAWQKNMGSSLSNFNPGSRIGSLVEAIAIELADGDLNTLNGLKQAIIEGSYYSFGFSRLPGTVSGGFARIEHAVAAGNIVYPQFTIDLFGIKYQTVSSVTLLAGNTYVEVDIISLEIGSQSNCPAGTIDTDQGRGTLDQTLPADSRVWNPSAITGGTDEESDIARLNRWKNYIRGLGRSNIYGILAGLAAIPGMVSYVLQVNINPYTNLPEDGWVDCYVSDGSAVPSPIFLQLVSDTIAGKISDPDNYPGYAAAGMRVYVAPIQLYAVNVVYTVTVKQSSTLTNAEVLGLADNAAYNYVNNLPVGQDVLYDQLKASILKAHPDILKTNVTTPSADIVILPTYRARLGGTGGGTISGSETPREIPA